MLEALWSVEFGSNVGSFGAGIAVFETGRVLGGDSAFMYVGNYHVENSTVHATIKVTKYSDTSHMQSVFGPMKEFNLKLSGPANAQSLSLNGNMVENPSLHISINAMRRAELP